MAISFMQALDAIMDGLTTEQLEFTLGNAEAKEALYDACKSVVNRSRVEELWNGTNINERERILAHLLTGPERKVSAFALAGKAFSELPIYAKDLLCEFAAMANAKEKK